jgi:large subunit ribosomal protein L30
MGKIKIKLVRSGIGRPMKQKLTLQALGLTRLNKQVEHEATPQIVGMINKVKHLLEVEEV